MNENHETWQRRSGGKEVWTTRRGLSDDNKSRTNSSCPVHKLSFISWFLWFPWSHLYFEEKKKIIVSTPSFSHSHQYNWEPNFIVVVPISCAQRSNWSILRYEPAKKVTRLPSYETWARSLFLLRKNCKRWSFSWKTGVRFIFYLPLVYYPHMDRYTQWRHGDLFQIQITV